MIASTVYSRPFRDSRPQLAPPQTLAASSPNSSKMRSSPEVGYFSVGLVDFSPNIADSFSEVFNIASPFLHMKERWGTGVLADIGIDFDDFLVGFQTEVSNLLADDNDSRGVEELKSSRSRLTFQIVATGCL